LYFVALCWLDIRRESDLYVMERVACRSALRCLSRMMWFESRVVHISRSFHHLSPSRPHLHSSISSSLLSLKNILEPCRTYCTDQSQPLNGSEIKDTYPKPPKEALERSKAVPKSPVRSKPTDSKGVYEFLEEAGYAGPMKVGRSWTSSELRLKSFDDLHKLWFVCLKERTLLFTEQEWCRANVRHWTGGKSKLWKLKKTMARIKTVVNERVRAYKAAKNFIVMREFNHSPPQPKTEEEFRVARKIEKARLRRIKKTEEKQRIRREKALEEKRANEEEIEQQYPL